MKLLCDREIVKITLLRVPQNLFQFFNMFVYSSAFNQNFIIRAIHFLFVFTNYMTNENESSMHSVLPWENMFFTITLWQFFADLFDMAQTFALSHFEQKNRARFLISFLALITLILLIANDDNYQ